MELNKQQRQAVEAGDGPVLIVAGPGTGKTKTLTERIARLIKNGVLPEHILALTFTNKAAEEMQTRVKALLPKQTQPPKITTFHALGHELLTKATGELQLISDAERAEIIRDLPKPTAFKGLSQRELSLMLSRAKASFAHNLAASLQKLLDHYDQALTDRELYDFDDLLIKTYELLKSDTTKRPAYRYVLVDEFQDTNELQYALVPLLMQTQNLFVIGDPHQSIYGFRGAGAELFARFKADFPNHLAVTLTINYRSAPEIVRLTNAIFPKAEPLKAHQTTHGKVQAIEVLNEFSEADYVLHAIEHETGGSSFERVSHEGGGARLSDFAVLYRTHYAGTKVRQRLADSGIPHQVVGEGSPYEQADVQAIIAILHHVAEPTTESKKRLSVLKPLQNLSERQLDALLENLPTDRGVAELSREVADMFDLWAEREPKRRGLEHFIGTLVRFGNDLVACLRHLDWLAEQAFFDPTIDAITLLTIHAAKGLEFEHVFLCAAEEGILPLMRKSTETDIDEERRLFYVASSRARRELDILHTQTRANLPSELSRFVTELPSTVLPRELDPAQAKQRRRQQKRVQKRSQTSLF